MNSKQVERYLLRYLESMNCTIEEKTSSSVLVKLSPEADKDLTGRSYYWSFVEKTGVKPEPMTMRFVFDPAAEARIGTVAAPGASGLPPMAVPAGFSPPAAAAGGATPAASPAPAPVGARPDIAPRAPAGGESPATASASSLPANPAAPAPDSILGRYFGVSLPPISRIPTDTVTFGSRRLNQIFQVVRQKGRFIRLFEDNGKPAAGAAPSSAHPWLCVNYRIDLISDMKREELHSLGLHLGTGELVEGFWEGVRKRKLTTRIPAGIHLLPAKYTLNKAASLLEAHLEKKLKGYDHQWAEDAKERLSEELARIDGFYEEALKGLSDEEKEEGSKHYTMRREEAEWQYAPRIVVSVVNSALLHLT
ncbi:YqhG family protein [Gorillibacterium sp. CAU 1737]|uniref:YqhG family protein n=1 Tax=Gorillibacterium sp. CAU 1737 TaxID=3140362 RepID=UPI0032608186